VPLFGRSQRWEDDSCSRLRREIDLATEKKKADLGGEARTFHWGRSESFWTNEIVATRRGQRGKGGLMSEGRVSGQGRGKGGKNGVDKKQTRANLGVR